MCLSKLAQKVPHQNVVKILSAQVRVPGRGSYLKHSMLECKQRHVKSTSAQVEHKDVALSATMLLIQTVRYGCGRGLVDDPHDLETRDCARGLGRGALVDEHADELDLVVAEVELELCLRTVIACVDDDGLKSLGSRRRFQRLLRILDSIFASHDGV